MALRLADLNHLGMVWATNFAGSARARMLIIVGPMRMDLGSLRWLPYSARRNYQTLHEGPVTRDVEPTGGW